MKTNSKKIDEKLDRLEELQSQIELLNREYNEIREFIQEYMGDEEELLTENHLVKWTKITSNRFDQSAFKALHPDLYESFKTASSSRRFSFK